MNNQRVNNDFRGRGEIYLTPTIIIIIIDHLKKKNNRKLFLLLFNERIGPTFLSTEMCQRTHRIHFVFFEQIFFFPIIGGSIVYLVFLFLSPNCTNGEA
jgi:hypothetical protein